MATTKKSSVSVKAKNATVTKSNYDKSVAKYGQAKVDSAMKKNNMSIGGDSSGSSSSSKNTPQQEANIAKANAFKSSGSNTVTTTPVVKKTAQQEANIAKANAFKSSNVINTDGTSGSVLKSVTPKNDREKKLLDDKIAKFGYAKVEAHLNSKGRTIGGSTKGGPYDPKDYTSQAGVPHSDLYPEGNPDAVNRLEAKLVGYEESLDNQAFEKGEIIKDTAEEERLAQEEANKEKKERAEAREKEAKQIFNEYNKESEASKKAIEENLEAIKRTQTIAANAAAAQAGQGAGLSEGARQQLEADIANRAAANINTATGSAIEQSQGITEAQKTAGMQGLTEQDKVDTLKNTLSDSEWNVFIKSIQEVGLAKTLAKDTYTKFLNESISQESIKGTFNRADMMEKVDSWNNDFKDPKSTRTYKAKLIEQLVGENPAYAMYKQDALNLIDSGLDLIEIEAVLSRKSEANYRKFTIAQNAAIQDQSVLQKSVKDLTEDEVKYLFNSLNK